VDEGRSLSRARDPFAARVALESLVGIDHGMKDRAREAGAARTVGRHPATRSRPRPLARRMRDARARHTRCREVVTSECR
jgi:hypothetical protein